MLLDGGLLGDGQVVVLQPRRLPTRMLASWVAQARGVILERAGRLERIGEVGGEGEGDVPVLVGTTRDEMKLFNLTPDRKPIDQAELDQAEVRPLPSPEDRLEPLTEQQHVQRIAEPLNVHRGATQVAFIEQDVRLAHGRPEPRIRQCCPAPQPANG